MHSLNRTMQLLRVDSATIIARKCFTHTIACKNLKYMVQDIWHKNSISTQILRNPRNKLLGVNNAHLWAPQNIVLKRQNGGSLRVWRIGVCVCLGGANRYPCSHPSSQSPPRKHCSSYRESASTNFRKGGLSITDLDFNLELLWNPISDSLSPFLTPLKSCTGRTLSTRDSAWTLEIRVSVCNVLSGEHAQTTQVRIPSLPKIQEPCWDLQLNPDLITTKGKRLGGNLPSHAVC
jgi:hypothetical protein